MAAQSGDKFWLAARGARQADLAERFNEEAAKRGLRLLALKGVAIAEELYGGASERPMADVDVLVIDTERFAEGADVAREMGLREIDASDHALVFKEAATGVVLELHIALTACPGLFAIDMESVWSARVPVAGASYARLSDIDLILHAALHTAFQHGFAANRFHYDDFVRGIETLRPDADALVARGRSWGAQKTLAAMTVASWHRVPHSERLRRLAAIIERDCPRRLARQMALWNDTPPEFSLGLLARVRAELAPSLVRWLWRSLLPETIPGRRLPRDGAFERLARLLSASAPRKA